MVDNNGSGAHPGAARFERRGGGQGKRIRSPAEAHEHEFGGGLGAKNVTHGPAHIRDGRSEAAAAFRLHPVTLAADLEQGRKKAMAEYDAVIEIPRGSRNKYEVDHKTGRVYLDRVLYTSFMYPTDYGYFENTLGLDGDPVDVLVLLDYPLFPGVGVSVRPVAVFNMTDDGGSDAKVIAVPAGDPRWNHIQDVLDIPEYTRKEIEHFFEHYKDLEPGKWVKTEGWGDAAEADQIVRDGVTKLAAEGH